MSASRYRRDPVTGGLEGTNDAGTVVERIQPNRATGGLDVYRDGRLDKQIIPDNLGGFGVFRDGKLVERR